MLTVFITIVHPVQVSVNFKFLRYDLLRYDVTINDTLLANL